MRRIKPSYVKVEVCEHPLRLTSLAPPLIPPQRGVGREICFVKGEGKTVLSCDFVCEVVDPEDAVGPRL